MGSRCDHGVWGYGSDPERADAATAWLAGSLRDGWRAVYVVDGPVERAVADLSGLGDVGSAVNAGALVVLPGSAFYDVGAPIDPARQLAVYAAGVQQALTAGFRGVRAAADITATVRDPAHRGAHLRWEQLADRYIADHPFAPLCMYDTRVVTGIETIVCAHPMQGPQRAPFAVYGGGARRAALDGEVDTFSAETLEAVLDALPDSDEVLDLSGLTFIDGKAAATLHVALQRRQERGRGLAVTGAPRILQRLWEVLGYDRALLEAA